MKKILLLAFIFISVCTSAQLLEENFDYATGTLTTVASNWGESPSGSTDVQVANGNLSYSNYPSSNIGKLIILDGGATGRSGIYRIFTAQSTSGSTVYWSFLLYVTSTSDMDVNTNVGEYFANFQNSGASTIRSYVYVRQGSNSSKYSIGLAKSSSSSLTWHGTELDINTTYLIVVGYSFVSGTGNDIAKLWINPSLSGSEPLADVSISSGADATDIGLIQFRQQSKSGDMQIDGIRVATSWSEGPLPVELTMFKALVEKEKVKLNWSTATEVNNYGFDVERKCSNSDWKKIGFVQGYGNSNSPKNYSYTDQPLGDVTFKYRLKQIDFDGTFDYSPEVEVKLDEVKQFVLEQNYPNPFNPTTTIRFSLPISAMVSINVFNLLIKKFAELLSANLNEGYHEINFDGSNLTSGIYFYQLRAGDFKATKKFIISK